MLSNGKKRANLKLNEWAAVQIRGEDWKCESWKNNCGGMDSICKSQRWKIIGLEHNVLVGQHSPMEDTSYVYDTIFSNDYAKYRKSDPDFYYYKSLGYPPNSKEDYRWVIRKAKFHVIRRFHLDSIESIAFPRNPRCSGFDLGTASFGFIMMIMAPFAARDSTGFKWGIWGGFTGFGLVYTGMLYRSARNVGVRRYATREFEIRIK